MAARQAAWLVPWSVVALAAPPGETGTVAVVANGHRILAEVAVTPEVNAASAMVILLTVVLTTITLKLQGRMGTLAQQGH